MKMATLCLALLLGAGAMAAAEPVTPTPKFEAWNRNADNTHLDLLRNSPDEGYLLFYEVTDPAGSKSFSLSTLHVESVEKMDDAILMNGSIPVTQTEELAGGRFSLTLRVGGYSELQLSKKDGTFLQIFELPKSRAK